MKHIICFGSIWFKAGFLDDVVVVDSVVFIVTGDTVKISFENLC